MSNWGRELFRVAQGGSGEANIPVEQLMQARLVFCVFFGRFIALAILVTTIQARGQAADHCASALEVSMSLDVESRFQRFHLTRSNASR